MAEEVLGDCCQTRKCAPVESWQWEQEGSIEEGREVEVAVGMCGRPKQLREQLRGDLRRTGRP